MSTPAITGLKQTFGCKITLLTSSMASSIAPYLDVIDDVIIYDAPWVKGPLPDITDTTATLVQLLKQRSFDGAVIFTTFSQNPMPAMLLAYQARIPLCLGYCRENPYQLLTHWLPEKEPYTYVRHQVRRDLDLVKSIGALPIDENIHIRLPQNEETTKRKLIHAGVNIHKPWLVLHAGVSELKRQYPAEAWADIASRIVSELDYQVILTGTSEEQSIIDVIMRQGHKNIFSTAGTLDIAELITIIRLAPLIITVNTSTVHLASTVGTPVVVLYAMTNPQHTPWNVPAHVLPFEVSKALQSKNEVLRFVCEKYFPNHIDMPTPDKVIEAVRAMLLCKGHQVSSASRITPDTFKKIDQAFAFKYPIS